MSHVHTKPRVTLAFRRIEFRPWGSRCGQRRSIFPVMRRRCLQRSGGGCHAIRQNGQGMTEYIVIVALIAIAAIAVYQLFGQVVRSQTAAMTRELAGEDGSAESRAAQEAANRASSQTSVRTLKSFTGNAGAGGQ